MGTKEAPPLSSLQKKVADICSNAGFVAETRPYKPHITIARNWQANKSFQLPTLGHMNVLKDLVWDVTKIHLYRSHMDRIPKYEPLIKFTLKEARRG